MATIAATPLAALFFSELDPYRWDVDNRPLQKLLDNDIAMNIQLEAIYDEVVAARTGLSGPPYVSLDARLDAMEDSIGAAVSISDVEDLQGFQYGDFIASSEAVRRATPSGFLDHNGIGDLNIGDQYDDFGSIRTTTSLGAGYENSIVLWSAWGSSYRPIRAVVNGWVVRLFNEKLGSPGIVPSNHVTLGLGSASATGKLTNFVFLEVWLAEVDKDTPVFYKYGAVNTNSDPATVTDPLHPEVIHTVRGMAVGGNWIQVRHRLRLVSDVTNPDADRFGFNASALAQGSTGAPVAGYTFSNMFSEIDDAGLWRAGVGDETSKTDLGSYDGYVYAIPVAMVHRRNSGEYTVSAQNSSRIVGDATSGYLSSGESGRPDGLYYDAIDQRDILDLRHRISLSGFDLKEHLDRTWQMLIRGELRTNWKNLSYDYNNDNTWEAVGVWGHTLTNVDEIANSAAANTNPIRDRQVTDTNPTYNHPIGLPDSARSSWGKTPTMQFVKFTFTQGNSGSPQPSGFVTYSPGAETLTFNAATLSGAGGPSSVGGTKIGSVPPIIMKKDALGTKPSLTCQGLGTRSATAKMTGLTPAAEYVGFIPVVYPGGSGLSYPYKRILTHEVLDNGLTSYPSVQYGVTGTPGSATGQYSSPRGAAKMSTDHYVISDCFNHVVKKVLISTGAVVATFGVLDTAGSDNTHCHTPFGVCVDGSDNVYFCDYGNHRVVKLNSSLVYQGQYGVTGTLGSDNTKANYPTYIAFGGSNIFFTDQFNDRLVKLNPTTMAYVSQFGTTAVPGAGKYGLNKPAGVAYITAGFGASIWVADQLNKRVVILDTNFVMKYQIAAEGQGSLLAPNSPTDIAVDNSGNIFVTVGSENTVYKYNSSLVLVGRFGNGQPGSANLTIGASGAAVACLNSPGGLCIDENNNYLYVCDSFNHRVLRLNKSDMTFLKQFGITGGSAPSPGATWEFLCPYPADIAIDDTGATYVVLNFHGTVVKLSPTMVYNTHFGTYTQRSDSFGLISPLGIAVKNDGTSILVLEGGVDTSALARRIVVLNSSLLFVRSFKPQFNTALLSRELNSMYDIEYIYDSGSGQDHWYVSGYERPRGTNTESYAYPVVWRFTGDSPTGTPNYSQRIEGWYGPTGLSAKPTKLYLVTKTQGIAIFDRTNPTIYELTGDPLVTVKFNFTRPVGVAGSGNYVLVTEQDIHCVQCFSTDGIYLSAAGVPYESGDDDCKLYYPSYAFIHDKYLVVCDSFNHRILRRHIASPWISSGGTISTMTPPVGADRVRVFYEAEAYQGMLNASGGGEAIWKSQVRFESGQLMATTLGLGSAMTNQYSEFQHLRGLTSRLPLPDTWNDWSLSPIGLKIGTSSGEDDGPYLSVPVTISEGLMGGQTNITQEQDSVLSSKQVLQQICRTVAGSDNPLRRGLRSVLARQVSTNIGNALRGYVGPINSGSVFVSESSRGFTDPIPVETKTILDNVQRLSASQVYTTRFGVPPVKSYNLLEAVPHFTYYQFIYMRAGRPVIGVIAEASNAANISVGSYEWNAVDGFYPVGRLLFR